MKFHTTLRLPAKQVTVMDADEITDAIRELGYPGDLGQAWKREDDLLVWECEFEGDTLTEISERYTETQGRVAEYLPGWNIATWTADPDDPIEVATRAAKDVLAWEQHIEGIDLPDALRESLQQIAGTDWSAS